MNFHSSKLCEKLLEFYIKEDSQLYFHFFLRICDGKTTGWIYDKRFVECDFTIIEKEWEKKKKNKEKHFSSLVFPSIYRCAFFFSQMLIYCYNNRTWQCSSTIFMGTERIIAGNGKPSDRKMSKKEKRKIK